MPNGDRTNAQKLEIEERVRNFQEQIIAEYGNYTFYKIKRQGGGNIKITIKEEVSAENYFNMFVVNNNKIFVFWSKCKQNGVLANEVASTIAERIGGLTLSWIKKNNKIDFCRYNFNETDSRKEFAVASAFMAAHAKGKVYFIAPNKWEFEKNSKKSQYKGIWQNFELPTLLKNPEVTQIYRIDAEVYDKIKDLDKDNDAEQINNYIAQYSLKIFDREISEKQYPNLKKGNQEAVNAIKREIFKKLSVETQKDTDTHKDNSIITHN